MIIRFTILYILYFLAFSPSFANDLEILDDGSTAGYITLGWLSVSGNNFELKEKLNDQWRSVYKGDDRASTLSGLSNGSYIYELTADGKVSKGTIKITIQHHPLTRAWIFFATGAAMFLVLILILSLGEKNPNNRKHHLG